jgi:hypothetical protein
MAYCSSCGHLISDAARFCRKCGAEQDIGVDRPSQLSTAPNQPSGEPEQIIVALSGKQTVEPFSSENALHDDQHGTVVEESKSEITEPAYQLPTSANSITDTPTSSGERKDVSTEEEKRELRGVDGWLGFLCISLTMLSPSYIVIAGVISLLNLSVTVGSQSENIFTTQHYMLTVFALRDGAIALLGIVAGVLLWNKRTPRVVWVTVLFLIFVPISAVLAASAVGEHPTGSTIPFGIDIFGRSLMGSALWLYYLLKSKRVENTYDFHIPRRRAVTASIAIVFVLCEAVGLICYALGSLR